MANLTEEKKRSPKGKIDLYTGVIGTDGTYYAGAILVIDPATGKLTNPTDVINLRPLGILQKTVTRSGTDVQVICERARVKWTISGITQADVGKPVYATDNDTLALVATANKAFGYIVEYLGGDEVYIEMGIFAGVYA
jgi:hypothetical protein